MSLILRKVKRLRIHGHVGVTRKCPGRLLQRKPVASLNQAMGYTRPGERLHFAMENGHRNSGFSHEKWWIFPWQNVNVHQRVHGIRIADSH